MKRDEQRSCGGSSRTDASTSLSMTFKPGLSLLRERLSLLVKRGNARERCLRRREVYLPQGVPLGRNNVAEGVRKQRADTACRVPTITRITTPTVGADQKTVPLKTKRDEQQRCGGSSITQHADTACRVPTNRAHVGADRCVRPQGNSRAGGASNWCARVPTFIVLFPKRTR